MSTKVQTAAVSEPRRCSRRSSVLILVVVLLVFIVALVAFAVDLGHVWRTQAQLQNAADSAALAAGSRLAQLGSIYRSSSPQPAIDQFLTSHRQQVIEQAQFLASQHTAGFEPVALRPEEIRLGYIPPAAPRTPFQEYRSGDPFPNAVEVTARRDNLDLYFAPVLGLKWAHPVMQATAMVRPAWPGQSLLPIGMHIELYRWLIRDPNQPLPPPGVEEQDLFKVQPPSSDLVPPANVTRETAPADQVREGRVFPDPGDDNPAGAFGLINLDNSRSSASAELIENWIRDGPSQQVLDSWGEGGLWASPETPLTMGGQAGLQASQQANLLAIVGEPRVMPVYRTVSGPGSNAQFEIVGFIGVTVCDVRLTGGPNTKHLTIQITGVHDSSGTPPATLPPGEWYVYLVSLVR